MTLKELQNILGERINVVTDTTLSKETYKREIEKSKVISDLAKQMISNADVVLRATKLAQEGLYDGSTIKKLVE